MLKIQNLICGYDSKFILQDINFEIEDKELVGIIGPNGSGKTTLLRSITGLLRPIKGAVFLEGKDIRKTGVKDLAKKIAVVSQDIEVANTTVEEFVLLGRIPHFGRLQFLETKEDFEIAARCMDLTGVSRFRDQLMGRISGGERQLTLIARALAQEPKLLLLDEPTTHLDIAHQIEILDLIKRLNRQFGLTVVMVLHDLNLASEYCHKLILLNQGRLYKMGKPKEVLDYRTIEEVYRTVVVVERSPVSSKPYVFVISEEEREKGKS